MDNPICPGCGNGFLVYCEVCGARERRARLRFKQRACMTCEKSFTTTRTDARFCSNGCRQKHYRRVTDKRGVADAPREAVTVSQNLAEMSLPNPARRRELITTGIGFIRVRKRSLGAPWPSNSYRLP